MVSILIAARNEIYLEHTIRDILSNAEGEIEVIVELDGYLPDPIIDMKDNRVTFVHHKESIGQRQCINHAAGIAKGKYILKTDAHSAFDKGFDVKLAKDCEYDWTVIPRMYNLDVETWKPKRHKLTDYMYLSNRLDDSFKSNRELRAEYYTGQYYRDIHRRPELIDDVMTGQGACWFMHKDRFWELGGMDEKHGSWGQMGCEVACKAWLSGGSLKVNKNTWFSHYFRGEKGGFPYPISGKAVELARTYSRDLWLNNKWDKQVRDFKWLVNKFQPPTWEKHMVTTEEMASFAAKDYMHCFSNERHPLWRGVKVSKLPTDLELYQEVIWNNRPDVIIECGTYYGGSALFFADMLEMTGKGKVLSIDIAPKGTPAHPRVTYLTGRATSAETLSKVKEFVKPTDKVMVVLDSDHHRAHVKRELYYYNQFVTKGQFIVVEDVWAYSKSTKTYSDERGERGPKGAVEWFLRRFKGFKRELVDRQFLITISRDGWLKRL